MSIAELNLAEFSNAILLDINNQYKFNTAKNAELKIHCITIYALLLDKSPAIVYGSLKKKSATTSKILYFCSITLLATGIVL